MGYQGMTSGVGDWVNVTSDGREVKRKWSVGSTWIRARKEQRLRLGFYCRTRDKSAGWDLKERREW